LCRNAVFGTCPMKMNTPSHGRSFVAFVRTLRSVTPSTRSEPRMPSTTESHSTDIFGWARLPPFRTVTVSSFSGGQAAAHGASTPSYPVQHRPRRGRLQCPVAKAGIVLLFRFFPWSADRGASGCVRASRHGRILLISHEYVNGKNPDKVEWEIVEDAPMGILMWHRRPRDCSETEETVTPVGGCATSATEETSSCQCKFKMSNV
jgi:hypothetical protein